MDSFYDAPRRPPVIHTRERLLSAPVVPEISVLCQPNSQQNDFTSYNQWKVQQNPYQNKPTIANKENYCVNASYLKKQVRFQNPVLQQQPSLSYEPILPKTIQNREQKMTFEQMYMANIPNKQLDLSIIQLSEKVENAKCPDVGSKCDEVKKQPRIYKKVLEAQKLDKITFNDSVTDIFNYKRSTNVSAESDDRFYPKVMERQIFDSPTMVFDSDKRSYESPKSAEQEYCCSANNIQSSLSPKINGCSCYNQRTVAKQDEPSVKDLIKIISQQSVQIAQQNEQLLLLQKQVSTLLAREDTFKQKQIENGPNRYMTSTQHETYRFAGNRDSPHKKGPKFSIDLMTSLEVSVRHPHNNQQNKRDFVNYCEPKIQEVTDAETCTVSEKMDEKTMVDSSIMLQEPIKVRETCPSPDPSIRIDMNDYEDSDEEDDCASEIGATFYNHLMEQVNNILHKAQIKTCENLVQTPNGQPDFPKLRSKPMRTVKEATLRHLKSIGINVPESEDTLSNLSSEESTSYDAEEISFAVKQLLMKYLPDEHLAKVSCKTSKSSLVKKQDLGAIPSRPEFSFATVQYMKKYNLIAASDLKERGKGMPNGPKILDITKLKQQPKLL